ncbi:hypothetical protein YC2023_030559 [Brassica napus]
MPRVCAPAFVDQHQIINSVHVRRNTYIGKAMGRDFQLYDVEIEEKANYEPWNVPLISLESKLNDEAVVGHPSTVEMLEDGSCDRVLCSHIKSLVVPMFDCDVKPKPSKSKNKKPHMPLHKSSKSKKVSPLP